MVRTQQTEDSSDSTLFKFKDTSASGLQRQAHDFTPYPQAKMLEPFPCQSQENSLRRINKALQDFNVTHPPSFAHPLGVPAFASPLVCSSLGSNFFELSTDHRERSKQGLLQQFPHPPKGIASGEPIDGDYYTGLTAPQLRELTTRGDWGAGVGQRKS